jgi:hypothetical protein
MKGEMVKVVVSMPKPLADFITKLAACEGSTPSEWYAHALAIDVNAILGDAHDVFDVPRLVKSNGLQPIIGKVP